MVSNAPMSKAEAVALACNFLVDEFLALATRHDGVRNYYDIAILSYSGHGIKSMLSGDGFVSITELAKDIPPLRHYSFEQRRPDGGTTYASFDLHSWVHPTAYGDTPMHEALSRVYDMIDEWCHDERNRDSFPPLVFHISDGECTDADPHTLISLAERIMACSTNDGNTLIFNIHLTTDSEQRPLSFPSEHSIKTSLRHQYLLYRMSSILPERMERMINNKRDIAPYRCVAINASFSELMMMLNIGSESVISR